ncbi:MAG: hypothetical protein M3Q69_14625 [Acidobacteriota bacterium]|nr:hypothetical protein [Acidobacteriota bacterium]
MKKSRLLPRFAQALLALFAATPLLAATHVWTGDASNRFSDAANWRGGSPAGDAEAELIFPDAVRQSIVNDLDALTVRSITFETNGYELRGNALDLLEGAELQVRENTIACALRFDGEIIDGPVRGSATFTRNTRSAVAEANVPGTNAQSTVLRFESGSVYAKVSPSTETAWLALVRHTGYSGSYQQRLAARRSDTDGDGVVQWVVPDTELSPFLNSKWCVVDINARKMYAANRDGSELTVQPLNARFLVDRNGDYSVIDLNWGNTSAVARAILWVRPGVGTWSGSSIGAAVSSDGQSHARTVVSELTPVDGSPAPPAGVQRGDFIAALSISAQESAPTGAQGGLVDAALAAAETNSAEIALRTNSSITEGSNTYSYFFLYRYGSSERPITVNYRINDDTATAGVHFQPTAGTVTLERGEVFRSVPIPLIDDDVYSETVRAVVEITGATGGSLIGESTSGFRIVDNDPPPVLSASSPIVAEGGDGPHTAPVKLTLTGKTRASVDVSWRAYPEGLSPSDYSRLTFAPGETEKTILIPYNGNTVPGRDVTMIVELYASNATVPSWQVHVTIQDDDSAGVTGGIVEITEGAGNATVKVTLDAAMAEPVTVRYQTRGEGSVTAADYDAVSGTLTFAAGETQKSIGVPIHQDATPENDEQIIVALTAVTPANLPIRRDGRIIIHDDGDQVSHVEAVATDPVIEGTFVYFYVKATPELERPARVGVRLIGGTAQPRQDFAADFVTYETANGVIIHPGVEGAFLILGIVLDLDIDPDETFSIEFYEWGNPTHSLGRTTFVIKDATASPPKMRISNVSVREGSFAAFQVTLSEDAPWPVSFRATTIADSAEAGLDFTPFSNVYTIEKGQKRVAVEVRTIDDRLIEGDETFAVQLSQADRVLVTDAIGRATIVDDDLPEPVFSIANVAVRESGLTAQFTVQLATPPTQRVTLTYATIDGSAIAGEDYVTASGTLVFEPGETTKTIDVALVNDDRSEADETLTLRAGATTEALCTITDDDAKTSRKRSVRH